MLPWRLPADLKNFKNLTMGHYLILGRKTFESIGRILPGRKTIVVTRNLAYGAAGYDVVHSLETGIELAQSRGEDEVFIGGGGDVYNQALHLADRIYLTLVRTKIDADTYFPEFDESQWRLVETWHHDADEFNEYPFDFKVLER
jgi:dihydrofolate reductase